MPDQVAMEMTRKLRDHDRRIERLETVENPLVTGGGLPLSAGPDIDISATNVIQREGIDILLFSGAAILLAEFAHTGAGLILAAAASTAGDIIEIPAGTITGDITIPTGVTLRGRSRNACIINGQVTIDKWGILDNVSIIRSEQQVGALIGIDTSDTCYMINVDVYIQNAGGPAYGVQVVKGYVYAYEAWLRTYDGATHLHGYAAYVTGGKFCHYSGKAIGDTLDPSIPYYINAPGEVYTGHVVFVDPPPPPS